jgi:hypothetical protein
MTTYFVIIAIHLYDTIVANNNLELVSNIETNLTKVYDMTFLDDIQFIFEIKKKVDILNLRKYLT